MHLRQADGRGDQSQELCLATELSARTVCLNTDWLDFDMLYERQQTVHAPENGASWPLMASLLVRNFM